MGIRRDSRRRKDLQTRRKRQVPYGSLWVEHLEIRLLMAGDWQNQFNRLDINNDNVVVPQDVLVAVNELVARNLVQPDGRLPVRSLHESAPFYDVDGDDFLVPQDILQVVNGLNADSTPPVIQASLAHDTAPAGTTNTDGLTFDATISGTITDEITGVGSLKASVDGGAFVGVTLSRTATPRVHAFSFEPGAIADGPHTIRLRAVDGRAHESTGGEVTFTLDTFADPPQHVQLTAETDTGALTTDGVTSSSLPIVQGSSEIGALVQVELDGQPIGQVTSVGSAWELPLGAVSEGNHTITATAQDAAGNVGSMSGEFLIHVDRTAPDKPEFDLDLDSDSFPVGDHETALDSVTLVGRTAADKHLDLLPLSLTATSDEQGGFQFIHVPLAGTENSFTVRAMDLAGNRSEFTRIIKRPSFQIELHEGPRFLTEATFPVDLGQAQGSRTIRFELDLATDASDDTAATEDVFLAYLVDPADPTRTLLDRGEPGTALFAMANGQPEYRPGVVRFDGRTVTINATSVTGVTSGLLKFQLISLDLDEQTAARLRNITSTVDVASAQGLVFPAGDEPRTAGGALDLALLNVSADVTAELNNVRVNSTTGRYTADLRVRNNGSDTIGRRIAVVFPELPPEIQFLNPSGSDADGNAYVNFRDVIPSGGLMPGGLSLPIQVELDNPNLQWFYLTTRVVDGGPNQPPVLQPLADLSLMPGDWRDVPLVASDPDGDTVTISIPDLANLPGGALLANGTLVIQPAVEDLGSYSLQVVASDGASKSSQQMALDVIADPEITTRISGQILQTNGTPLGGLRVEVGAIQGLTAADGSFTLDLGSGPVVGDTLKVRGELLSGPLVFPFIAEKVAFLLDHAVQVGANNVIRRPVFLPPLDMANAKSVDPQSDTTVTTDAIPGASVFVAAGTLLNQQGTAFDGELSITEVPVNLTPAALPKTLIPDLVVTIQPGEMAFAQPAPLTLPNRSGRAPGTPMNLWSINPVTGEFELVGTGAVSSDASVVETLTGGIRNSSWHFWAPLPPVPFADPPEEDCGECQATGGSGCTFLTPAGPNGSQPTCFKKKANVPLREGNLILPLPLFAYESCGDVRGLSLEYDSLRADSRPILTFGYQNVGLAAANDRMVAQASVSRGDFSEELPGNRGSDLGLTGGEHFWKIPSGAQSVRAGLQADLSDQPSGVYDYTLTTGLRTMTGSGLPGAMAEFTGKIVNANYVDSVFGVGWGMAGLQELVVNEDGSVLIMDGGGSEEVFSADSASGVLQASPGDFSKLERMADGSHVRTMADQTTLTYGVSGMLEKQRDRTGQEVLYIYDGANRLIKFVDPAGLETLLAYQGRYVSQITDPAGRITRLEHNAAGHLTKVIYADESEAQFTYTPTGLMTSVTDALGNKHRFGYDEFGRVSTVTAPDKSVESFAPADTKYLASGDTTDPENPPFAKVGFSLTASSADASGNVRETTMDARGQMISATDAVGRMPSLERNSQNLVSTVTDARGFKTTFTYDAAGNILEERDDISATTFETLGVFEDQLHGRGGVAREVAVGDLDRDGIMDLVGIYEAATPLDMLAVYFGRSDGTFSEPTEFEYTPSSLRDVALADLDNDDDLDVLVGHGGSLFGAVAVYLNSGGGTLTPRIDYRVGDTHIDLAVGDVNSDGFLDVVSANTRDGDLGIGGPAGYSVLLNNQAGAFAPATIVPLPQKPLEIQLGKVDSDDDLDLFFAVRSSANQTPKYFLLLGNGNGSFGAPTTIAEGRQTSVAKFADFNEDGNLDLIAGAHTDSPNRNMIAVHSGDGTGAFAAPVDILLTGEVRDLELADVDGDGDQDIVAATRGNNTLVTLLDTGTAFSLPATQTNSGFPDGIALAHMDGDDRIDLVTTNSVFDPSFQTFSSGIAVRPGHQDGTFGSLGRNTVPRALNTLPAVGDVTGDTNPDVIVITTNNFGQPFLQLLVGDGQGGYSQQQIIATTTAGDPVLFDADGDADLDLLTALTTRYTNGETFMELRLNDGLGNFAPATRLGLGISKRINSFTIADHDGDLDQDIVVGLTIHNINGAITGTRVEVFENLNSIFVDFGAGADADGIPKALAVGDVDLDGQQDIIIGSQQLAGGNSIRFARGLGNDTYATSTHVANASATIAAVVLFDANHDNDLDLAFADTGGRVQVFLGTPVGFAPLNTILVPVQAASLLAADFDRDGSQDLLVDTTSNTGGRFTLLHNDGEGRFPTHVGFAAGSRIRGTVVADLNHDQFPDVILSDLADDTVLTRVNQLGVRPPNTQPRRFTYDPVFNQPLSATDERGNMILYSIDPVTGNRLSMTEVVGTLGGGDDRVTTYTYTDKGMIDTITDPLGRVIDFDYDECCRLIGVTFAAGTADEATQHFAYDTAGNTIGFTDENGAVTAYEYDVMNRLTKVIYPDPDGAGPLPAPVFIYVYDAAGRRIRETDANGNTTLFGYNSRDELVSVTDALGRVRRLTYDGAGNVIGLTDELGRTFRYAYDERNRLIALTDPLGGVQRMQYDGDDNITSVTDSLGRTRELVYDARSRLVQSIDPIGGVQRFEYDSVDNLVRVIDKNVRTSIYAYDDLNRLVTARDALGQVSNYTYDIVGNLTVAADTLGRSTHYAYDNRDRLVHGTDPLGGVTEYFYDPAGNVLAATDELGRTTTYVYDALNRRIRDTDPLNSSRSYAYDSMSNMTRETDELGRSTVMEYDALNRLSFGIDPLGKVRRVEYDAVGNAVRIVDELGHVTQMEYDGLNRRVRLVDARGGVVQNQYDLVGNQLSSKDQLGRETTYSYDALDRLIRSTDALGGVVQYEYDPVNNLLGITDELGRKTEFQYDPLDRRVRSLDPLGNELLAAYDAVGNLTGSTDELGRKTHYAYDELDRLIQVTDPLNGNMTFGYDAVDNMTSVTDPLGRATTFDYDVLNRMHRTTDALGGVKTFAYDAVGNLIELTDELGRRTSIDYDLRDRVIHTTDPLGGMTTLVYDAVGNITAQTDELGQPTRFEYDDLNRLIRSIDAQGGVVAYDYDPVGNVIASTDRLLRTTQYAYDALDRRTQTTDPLGGKRRYAYDAVGNVTSFMDELDRETRFEYDGLNRQVREIDPLGFTTEVEYDAHGNLVTTIDAVSRETHYEYDSLNRLIRQIDPLGGVRRSTYDAVGNATSTIDELGRTVTATYDALNRPLTVVDPMGHTTTHTYDAVGNLLTSTDALGHQSAYTYDMLDRMISAKDPSGVTTQYAFNAVDRLLSVSDPINNTTTFAYDTLNRLTSETNELGLARRYEYDAEANVTRMTDRNGRVRRFEYDALDRVTTEQWLAGDATVTRELEFSYDAASQFTAAFDPDSHYAFAYDANGRLTSQTNAGTPGVPEVKFTYVYDATDNLLSRSELIANSAGATNAYAYDALDRMTRVTQSGPGAAEKRVDMTYDAAGQMNAISRFADLAGNDLVAVSDYAYDLAGRLTQIKHLAAPPAPAAPLPVLAQYDLTYDAANRITQMASTDGTSNLTYDSRNQLTAANHSFQADESYTYDENGNRTLAGYATESNNRLLSDGVFNYEYDGEGNRTRRTHIATNEVTEYSWDYRNRLVSVVTRTAPAAAIRTQVHYAYDVFDNRITKSIDADGAGPAAAEVEHFIYDGVHIALALDGAGSVKHRYLHGPVVDMVLADEDAVGEVLWSLADHQGTIRDLVGSDGAIANHLRYDAFGNVTSETNPAVDFLFGYTGRERDEETGQYYYRARYYDPAVGRFLSEDPISFAGGDENLYAYVGNNAVNAVDPSGMATLGERCKLVEEYYKRMRKLFLDYLKYLNYLNTDRPIQHPISGLPTTMPPPVQPPAVLPPPGSGGGGLPGDPHLRADQAQYGELPRDPTLLLVANIANNVFQNVVQVGRNALSDELKLLAGRLDAGGRVLQGIVNETAFLGKNVLILPVTLVYGTYQALPGIVPKDAETYYFQLSTELYKEYEQRNPANIPGNLLRAAQARYDAWKGAVRNGDTGTQKYLRGQIEVEALEVYFGLRGGAKLGHARKSSPPVKGRISEGAPGLGEYGSSSLGGKGPKHPTYEMNQIHVDRLPDELFLQTPLPAAAIARTVNCLNCNLTYWYTKVWAKGGVRPRASALPLSADEIQGLARNANPAEYRPTQVYNKDFETYFPNYRFARNTNRTAIADAVKRGAPGGGGLVFFDPKPGALQLSPMHPNGSPNIPRGHTISVEHSPLEGVQWIDVQKGTVLTQSELNLLFQESANVNFLHLM